MGRWCSVVGEGVEFTCLRQWRCFLWRRRNVSPLMRLKWGIYGAFMIISTVF